VTCELPELGLQHRRLSNDLLWIPVEKPILSSGYPILVVLVIQDSGHAFTCGPLSTIVTEANLCLSLHFVSTSRTGRCLARYLPPGHR